jgi:hypothetical protein
MGEFGAESKPQTPSFRRRPESILLYRAKIKMGPGLRRDDGVASP